MIVLWPLLLPIAAASGWALAHKRTAPKPQNLNYLSREYFVGLNYLLNEQPDKAVDVFIKMLEVGNDTVETHLTLGSLFRRRGEADRAIRIHQNLIARPQLSPEQRTQALMALGRDYMSAGVFDRAERIFAEVVSQEAGQTAHSLKYLVDIYQQEKAWPQAINAMTQLADVTGHNTSPIIAHYYCEQADEALQKNDIETAKCYLRKAFSADKQSTRARLFQAYIFMQEELFDAAIKAYKQVAKTAPDFISEIIEPLMSCYEHTEQQSQCHIFLQQLLKTHPRISVLLALAKTIKREQGIEVAIEFIALQLRNKPSIRGLNQLIEWYIDTTYGNVKTKLLLLQNITHKLIENKPIYRCNSCGFGSKTLHWFCPGCKQWSVIKPIHGIEGD